MIIGTRKIQRRDYILRKPLRKNGNLPQNLVCVRRTIRPASGETSKKLSKILNEQ